MNWSDVRKDCMFVTMTSIVDSTFFRQQNTEVFVQNRMENSSSRKSHDLSSYSSVPHPFFKLHCISTLCPLLWVNAKVQAMLDGSCCILTNHKQNELLIVSYIFHHHLRMLSVSGNAYVAVIIQHLTYPLMTQWYLEGRLRKRISDLLPTN